MQPVDADEGEQATGLLVPARRAEQLIEQRAAARQPVEHHARRHRRVRGAAEKRRAEPGASVVVVGWPERKGGVVVCGRRSSRRRLLPLELQPLQLSRERARRGEAKEVCRAQCRQAQPLAQPLHLCHTRCTGGRAEQC